MALVQGYRPQVSTTAAIVLAAGASTRLGRPKQLIDWAGKPLLERVVSSTLDWPVDEVVVVLGSAAEEIIDAIDFGSAVVVVNEAWEEGIASSIRVGFDVVARDPKCEHAFVALGDQPKVPADVPSGLLAAAAVSSRPAVVPVYRYERGNPVLFDRWLWPRLMTLSGDTGASGLLLAHSEWVHEVRFDHLPPRDLDSESDVTDLQHGPQPSD
jgi:molybdenum cofactor cytidylyltransferase